MSSPTSSSPTAALAAPGTASARSSRFTAAALLNVLVSLVSIAFAAPLLGGGSTTATDTSDQPPAAILVLGVVLGVLGLVSSYGVWRVLRWGVILTIVLNVVQFLSGAPGIAFGSPILKVFSVIGCIIDVVIIWLLVSRGSDRVSGAHQ